MCHSIKQHNISNIKWDFSIHIYWQSHGLEIQFHVIKMTAVTLSNHKRRWESESALVEVVHINRYLIQAFCSMFKETNTLFLIYGYES